jgi:putative salt-induced outer membrane protein YdiY
MPTLFTCSPRQWPRSWLAVALAAPFVLGTAAPARAQAAAQPPPAPPKPWQGSVAAGVALTSGNTDTLTTNFAFDVQTDKTKRNVFKAEGLNLRSTQDGTSIVDRTSVSVKDEIALTGRLYAFGEFRYLRDVFKAIDYLMAPTAGLGYYLIDNDATTLSVDGSVGAIVEKNPGLARTTSGAVGVGEKFKHQLTSGAAITQTFAGLWKTDDFGDVLYTFGAGLAASLTERTQLKVEFVDTYKSRPPSLLVQKNDTALITSLVFKF